MNDTIVTFDRIRENLKILRREELEPLINKSVNQTLSRTVLTSGLTLLTALALLFFGGQVLNGFAFALTCGIIVGTYSSVFVASPILIFWHNFLEGRKRRRRGGVPRVTREPVRSGGRNGQDIRCAQGSLGTWSRQGEIGGKSLYDDFCTCRECNFGTR